MRIIAAHAYHRIDYEDHRIDYEEVWVTLRDDVPRLDKAIDRWRETQGLCPRYGWLARPAGFELATRILENTYESPWNVAWRRSMRHLAASIVAVSTGFIMGVNGLARAA